MLNQLQLGRRDASACALIDGPLEIGWVRADVIGFGGFEDRPAAKAAGEAAATIATHWMRTRGAGAPLVPFPAKVRDDAAIRATDTVVGRLLEPDEASGDLRGHGFEIALPSGTWLALKLELAQRIHRGLMGSRLAERSGDVAMAS